MADGISSANRSQVQPSAGSLTDGSVARSQLRKLASDLVSTNGSVKSGYLKLVEADGGFAPGRDGPAGLRSPQGALSPG